MSRYINPSISILIVLVVFVIAVFTILQGGEALNSQLSASVFDTTSNLVKNAETNNCLDEVYNDFLTSWNQECKAEGLGDKCSLNPETAYPLKARYQKSQNNCYY